jgi:hypothetical protein
VDGMIIVELEKEVDGLMAQIGFFLLILKILQNELKMRAFTVGASVNLITHNEWASL